MSDSAEPNKDRSSLADRVVELLKSPQTNDSDPTVSTALAIANNSDQFKLPEGLKETEADIQKPIFKTENPEVFERFKYNREPDEDHIERIMKSILSSDHTPSIPIVVTKEGKIADGQHRWEACKRLGLPVYFVVLDQWSEEDFPRLQEARQMKEDEWLHHFAERGYEAYEFSREFIQEEYPEFSLSFFTYVCNHFLDTRGRSNWRTEVYQAGRMSFTREDKDQLYEWFNRLRDIREALGDANVTIGQRFFKAWLAVSRLGEFVDNNEHLEGFDVSYNHQQMVEQLEKPHCQRIIEETGTRNLVNIKRALLKIYDYKMSADNKTIPQVVKEMVVNN